jgi:hypothetical protein
MLHKKRVEKGWFEKAIYDLFWLYGHAHRFFVGLLAATLIVSAQSGLVFAFSVGTHQDAWIVLATFRL